MPFVSIVFGILLTALGVWGYWGGALGLWEPLGFAAPDHLSPTALIPAGLGVALIVLGLLALNANLLKHAMHGAAMIGVLGLLAAVGRLVATRNTKGIGGTSIVVMALLCAVFVALCVNSFIQARRRRRATPSGL